MSDEAYGSLACRCEFCRPSCDSCKWFKGNKPSSYGRCARHAPVASFINGMLVTEFPRVYEQDHCGDYEAKA